MNPSSINGLNLYSYANNNPIGIAYRSSGSGANGGMVSSFMGNGVVSGGYSSSSSNAFSVKFPKQNWLSISADFIASMAGSLSVLSWTFKNPVFYDFLYSAYGISKYEMLSNLKSPLTKAAKWLSYGIVAYETYDDIKGHIYAGDSLLTTISSGLVTAGVGAFNVWAAGEIGVVIGGVIGGLHGFIIGIVVGVGVGVIIDGIFYTEINGKSIAGYIEDGIEGLLEWLF